MVIRTYQADHGGLAFETVPTRRDKVRRHRLTALLVIAAVAASTGLLQYFHDSLMPGGPAAPGSGVYLAAR